MAKSFSSLLRKHPPWFVNPGEEGDVIIGSMARVVRNLEGHRFPGWSTDEGRRAVADLLLPLIKQLPGNKTTAYCAEMTQLNYTQRRVLLERKLISQCMAARQNECHIVLNGKQDISFMINEEEHLVMHLFSAKNDYAALMKKAVDISTQLEKELTFAKAANGDYLTNDKLFTLQSDAIRSIASEHSCVIIGRCADYVLRENPDMVSVFIHADPERRVARVMERTNQTAEQARQTIKKTDRRRANYYNYFSDRSWGVASNYHLSLDSGRLGEDGCVEMILRYIELTRR